ncbi:MAG: hypothetical protein HETSPECPRED_009841 [Heterodermia speciosa]|uniref:F-box domain-containing protein n=1 Tax=Heterodermia speciosa TaxID=116794 RepID=A0A8H3IZ30_9LECA|nr:MAG: hypothetical protein HETSPECPRED_009841 [Heterodermia speciosa]
MAAYNNPQLARYPFRSTPLHDLPYSEDLLKYLAYNNRPLKGVIIDELVPCGSTELDPHVYQPRGTVASLGNLKLPIEIIRMVLLAMPYKDLVAFMAVNSAAFNVVVAMTEFCILNKYGGNVLRMLSKVHLQSCFSIADVYETFTSPSCSYCVSFGAYVFLPGLVRCCQNCAERDYRLIPISKNSAQKKIHDAGFNLTSQMVDNLPVMTTIPGYYAASSSEPAGKSRYKKQVHLLSRPLAEAAMIKRILQDDPKARLPEIQHNPAWYWSRQAKVLVSDLLNLPLSHRVPGWTPDMINMRTPSTAGKVNCFDKLISYHQQRSMALAPMPYFDKETKSIQEGFRCRGCCNPFDAPHQCTDDCYIPNTPLYPKVSEQNRTDYTGIVGPARVCVAKKLQSMEYLRRDFERHYQQCDGARDFCKEFASLIPTWERHLSGSELRTGPERIVYAVSRCLAIAVSEKRSGPF